MKFFIFSLIYFCSFTISIYAQGGGSCLKFDGVDDWLNCGTNDLNISDSITVEAWVKPAADQPTAYGRIVDKYNWYNKKGFNLVIEIGSSPGGIDFDFWGDDGIQGGNVGTTQVINNKWHHLAATYDGNRLILYTDGRIENQTTNGGKKLTTSINNLGIGNNFDGAAWFPYKGQIDEVKIWGAVLDSLVIRNWMFRSLTSRHPNYSDLAGYWNFDEGNGSMTSDLSGNGNNGMLTNVDTTGAWVSSTAPIATFITDTMNDLSAVWSSNLSSTSSILSVYDSAIDTDQTIIFGHNDGNIKWKALDVPILSVNQQLDRTWRVETRGTPEGDVLFDMHGISFSDESDLILLISQDYPISTADTMGGMFNQTDSSFLIKGVPFHTGYFYTLGTLETPDNIYENGKKTLPDDLLLLQNYPNPFNPSTTIKYSLYHRAHIQIEIFDISGKMVSSLINEVRQKGTYTIKFDGSKLACGIYFYRLKAMNKVIMKKMILIR